MDLSSILDNVIENLHDIKPEYLDPSNVRNDIRRAYNFVKLVVPSDVSDADLLNAVEAVATFYSYMTWTTLVEKEVGFLPASDMNKAAVLRSIAKGVLQPITSLPIRDDLTLDNEALSKWVPSGTAGLVRSTF